MDKKDRFYILNFSFSTEGVQPEFCNIPEKFYKHLEESEENEDRDWYDKDVSLICGLSVIPTNPKFVKDRFRPEGSIVLTTPEVHWTDLTSEEYEDLKSGKIDVIKHDSYEEPMYVVYDDKNQERIISVFEKIMREDYNIDHPFNFSWLKDDSQPVFYRYNSNELFKEFF